jgi:SAM-dependent methyltransferase
MKLNNLAKLQDQEEVTIGERVYKYQQGTLKPHTIAASNAQKQTQETFGFKWKKEDTFDSVPSLLRMKAWLLERYGDPSKWLDQLDAERPLVMDAGCGAGMSGFEYWGGVLDKIQYFGVDISEAVDVAQKRFSAKGFDNGIFLQDSISNLPFTEPSFDVIFSEGVLHHTDSTKNTFNHLCKFLKPGGLFMFYVYRKKGPIREYTDDFIREKLQHMSSEEGWEKLKGLSALGIELGKLDIEVDVPQYVEFLDIPAGKINLQRLFYWHVFKAFYDPNLTFDEMHHINFDWYAPKNAHRHTIEEVRQWCEENNLEIRHEKEELAGITCIAAKK